MDITEVAMFDWTAEDRREHPAFLDVAEELRNETRRIQQAVSRDLQPVKLDLKKANEECLALDILRNAWYEITLRRYKTEWASSKEQADGIYQEFKRLQAAVSLAECSLTDLDFPTTSSFENKDLQNAVHLLLKKWLQIYSSVLIRCLGVLYLGKSTSRKFISPALESLSEKKAMYQNAIYNSRMKHAKEICEFSQMLDTMRNNLALTSVLTKEDVDKVLEWEQLEECDLLLREYIAEERNRFFTPDMLEILSTNNMQMGKEISEKKTRLFSSRKLLNSYKTIWGKAIVELMDEYRALKAEMVGLRCALKCDEPEEEFGLFNL